jgi:hypothetical protein
VIVPAGVVAPGVVAPGGVAAGAVAAGPVAAGVDARGAVAGEFAGWVRQAVEAGNMVGRQRNDENRKDTYFQPGL